MAVVVIRFGYSCSFCHIGFAVEAYKRPPFKDYFNNQPPTLFLTNDKVCNQWFIISNNIAHQSQVRSITASDIQSYVAELNQHPIATVPQLPLPPPPPPYFKPKQNFILDLNESTSDSDNTTKKPADIPIGANSKRRKKKRHRKRKKKPTPLATTIETTYSSDPTITANANANSQRSLRIPDPLHQQKMQLIQQLDVPDIEIFVFTNPSF